MNEKFILPASIILSALIIGFAWIYTAGFKEIQLQKKSVIPESIEKVKYQKSENSCGV
ncbi:MAG: hypothetical protein AAB698_00230 [Patescibacteria group bacterium]